MNPTQTQPRAMRGDGGRLWALGARVGPVMSQGF